MDVRARRHRRRLGLGLLGLSLHLTGRVIENPGEFEASPEAREFGRRSDAYRYRLDIAATRRQIGRVDEPVVAIFDGVAAVYDEVVPFFATFGKLIAAALPDPGAGARLLDVGAGAGAIALAARERGYAVSAVDAAPGMVARLSRVVPDVRLADAAALPFPDRVFDVVTAGFVLHIVADPGAVLREIRRVLKPGGLLAFTVVGPRPDGFAEADASTELFAEFSRYLPPDGSMGEPFDERAELAAAGFRDVTEGHLQVELPLDDAETMWRWYATHGTRKFLDDLPPDRREELRRRLVADLAAREAVVLRRAAGFFTARA